MNVFEAVRKQVTARQAAEVAGLEINHSGMCICPFHDDHEPSMKVNERYHCFGCGADGDAIDLMKRLSGKSSLSAAKELAKRFQIPYEEPPPKTRQPRKERKDSPIPEEKRFEKELQYYIDDLRTEVKTLEPDSLDSDPKEGYLETVQKLSEMESVQEAYETAESLDEQKDVMRQYAEQIPGFQKYREEKKHETIAEAVKGLLTKGDHGQIRNGIHNTVTVFRNDPYLMESIRFNELTQRMELSRKMEWKRGIDSLAVNDTDIAQFHLYCDRYYGISNRKVVEETVSLISGENRYHPIRDFLNGLHWDCKSRIWEAMHRFLGAEESEMNYDLLLLYMLGAISRVMHPGTKFDYMLCLVGAQGVGKSSFFRFLAVQDDWFTDDLKDLDSDRVYQKLQGHWIIEISEMLATANAKSVESTKSFLSRNRDVFRTPYERYPKDRPRQCVFGGTTNKQHFLPEDRTGNRRFFPVQCSRQDAECFILDDEKASRAFFTQMWAEAMEIYRSGNYSLKPSKELEKELEKRRMQFSLEDIVADAVLDYMNNSAGNIVCSRLLYREALQETGSPQKWQLREIGDIINQSLASGKLKGWTAFKNPRSFGDYGRQKGWERIRDPEQVVKECRNIPYENDLPFGRT